MVPSYLCDGRAQHDEQMMTLNMGVQALANVGQGKHGLGLAAVQGGVKPVLNGRPDEQRVLRVVAAQMHPAARRRALLEQRQRHLKQGLDVCQPQQAKTHLLATARVNAVVLLVQRVGRGHGQLGELGMERGLVGAAFQRQRDQLAAAPGFIYCLF